MPIMPKTLDAAQQRAFLPADPLRHSPSRPGIYYQIWCFDWIAVLFEGKTGAVAAEKINYLSFKIVINF